MLSSVLYNDTIINPDSFILTFKNTKITQIIKIIQFVIFADARKENNFSKFAPVLQEIVDLKKEIVAVTHPQLGTVL